MVIENANDGSRWHTYAPCDLLCAISRKTRLKPRRRSIITKPRYGARRLPISTTIFSSWRHPGDGNTTRGASRFSAIVLGVSVAARLRAISASLNPRAHLFALHQPRYSSRSFRTASDRANNFNSIENVVLNPAFALMRRITRFNMFDFSSATVRRRSASLARGNREATAERADTHLLKEALCI